MRTLYAALARQTKLTEYGEYGLVANTHGTHFNDG